MNRIDRPARRVSSHQRRAAALDKFVRRHLAARSGADHGNAPLDSAGLASMLQEAD